MAPTAGPGSVPGTRYAAPRHQGRGLPIRPLVAQLLLPPAHRAGSADREDREIPASGPLERRHLPPLGAGGPALCGDRGSFHGAGVEPPRRLVVIVQRISPGPSALRRCAGPPPDRSADRGWVRAQGWPREPEAGFTLLEVLLAL